MIQSASYLVCFGKREKKKREKKREKKKGKKKSEKKKGEKEKKSVRKKKERRKKKQKNRHKLFQRKVGDKVVDISCLVVVSPHYLYCRCDLHLYLVVQSYLVSFIDASCATP